MMITVSNFKLCKTFAVISIYVYVSNDILSIEFARFYVFVQL